MFECISLHVMLTCNEFPSVSLGLAMAANIAVVVVPILDPRDRGYALSMLITPIPEIRNRMQMLTPNWQALLVCSRVVKNVNTGIVYYKKGNKQKDKQKHCLKRKTNERLQVQNQDNLDMFFHVLVLCHSKPFRLSFFHAVVLNDDIWCLKNIHSFHNICSPLKIFDYVRNKSLSC